MEPMTLDQVLANTGDGVFVVDRERRLVLFNPTCERITGYRASEVVASGSKCSDITDCADEQGRSLMDWLCPGTALLNGAATTARQRIRLTTRAGQHRWVEAQYVALRDERQRPKYIVAFLRDIADGNRSDQQWPRTLEELAEEVNRLHQQVADQYGLTGIVTRSPNMQPVLEHIRLACA